MQKMHLAASYYDDIWQVLHVTAKLLRNHASKILRIFVAGGAVCLSHCKAAHTKP